VIKLQVTMFARMLVFLWVLWISMACVDPAYAQPAMMGSGARYDLPAADQIACTPPPIGLTGGFVSSRINIIGRKPYSLFSNDANGGSAGSSQVSLLDPVTPTPLPANPAVVTFSMLTASAARGVGAAAALFLLGALYVRLRRNRRKE
jgi:hypothetical protein